MTEEFSLLSYLNVTVPDQVPVQKVSGSSSYANEVKKIFTPKAKPPASNYSTSESDFGLRSRSSSNVSSVSNKTPSHQPIKRSINSNYETTYQRTYSPYKLDSKKNEDVRKAVNEMNELFSDDISDISRNDEIPSTPAARNVPHPTPIHKQEEEEEANRPPFMSPSHGRRGLVVPPSNFLSQALGFPHEIRVSEVKVSQPGCDPIIYEVHDLELPPSAEELNAENERIKREQQKLYEDEDRLYSLNLDRENELFFNEQREKIEERKRKNTEDYELWKKQVQDKHEKDLLDKLKENEDERHQFNLANENARKHYENTINAKAKETEEYNRSLLQQIRDKERQKQEERDLERQLQFQNDDNSQELAQIQERLQRRRELLSIWDQQIENKEKNILEEKALDRKLFNDALERDLKELQEEYNRSRLAKEQMKQGLSDAWKNSIDLQQQKKYEREQEKLQELELKRQQDNKILAEQQLMLEERARRIQERKKGLDEQLSRLNTLRNDEKLQNESVEQEMLRKIREGLLRRKLYRDIRTKKILSGKEAKRIIPSSQYDN